MGDFKPGRRPRRDSRDRPKRDSRDRPRRNSGEEFSRRDSREGGMYKAVCDKCGKTCELPFKPTQGKPVYCDECFKKRDSGKKSDVSKELEQINEKLDRILKAIENNS